MGIEKNLKLRDAVDFDPVKANDDIKFCIDVLPDTLDLARGYAAENELVLKYIPKNILNVYNIPTA